MRVTVTAGLVMSVLKSYIIHITMSRLKARGFTAFWEYEGAEETFLALLCDEGWYIVSRNRETPM